MSWQANNQSWTDEEKAVLSRLFPNPESPCDIDEAERIARTVTPLVQHLFPNRQPHSIAYGIRAHVFGFKTK